MPVYNFIHNDTEEIWETTMPYADKDAYMEEHNCRAIFLQGPQVIGTSKDIYSKMDDNLKDRLTHINKAYPKKGPNSTNLRTK